MKTILMAAADKGGKSLTNKGTATPPPAKTDKKADTGDKAKGEGKSKRPRVRLQSTTEPKLWCRMYQDVLDKYGAPLDPKGVAMVPVKRSFGLTEEEKQARKAAKDAAKATFDAMSPEDQLAYTKAKREEKAKARDAKKEADRQALIAQLKKEIAEGKI